MPPSATSIRLLSSVDMMGVPDHAMTPSPGSQLRALTNASPSLTNNSSTMMTDGQPTPSPTSSNASSPPPTNNNMYLHSAQASPTSQSSHAATQAAAYVYEDDNSSNSSRSAPHDGTNLIVNYIPPGISEEMLRQLFQPYGNIERCKIVNDRFTGMSLGYGFIKYDNLDSAAQAVQGLNGHSLMNKRLKVSLSKLPEKDRKANLYISGLPAAWQQPELTELVTQFGPVLEVRILYDVHTHRCKGVGFARFENAKNAAVCIAALNGVTVPGGIMPLNVRFADTTSDKIRKSMTSGLSSTPSSSSTSMSSSPYQPSSLQQSPTNANSNYRFSTIPAANFSLSTTAQQQLQQLAGLSPQARFLSQQSPTQQQSQHFNFATVNQQQPQQQNSYQPDMLSAVLAAAAAQHQQQQQPQSQQNWNRSSFNIPNGSGGSGVLMQNGTSIHTNQFSSPTLSSSSSFTSQLLSPLSVSLPATSSIQTITQLPPPSTVESNFTGFCLFCYHLPLEATESTLFQLFSSFGSVTSAKVMRDLLTGRSKGFGFVNMANESQALAAINGLNGFALGSKFLKVSFKSGQTGAGATVAHPTQQPFGIQGR